MKGPDLWVIGAPVITLAYAAGFVFFVMVPIHVAGPTGSVLMDIGTMLVAIGGTVGTGFVWIVAYWCIGRLLGKRGGWRDL